MAEVVANMSMSLDGFIEDNRGGVTEVFAWITSGEVVFTMPGDDREFRTASSSAEHLRESVTGTGALVCGRRLFELAQGWGGHHPVGCPVFVVTHQAPAEWAHPDAPFTFVTDGVASAIRQAQAVAGERTVAVASADIAQQALDLACWTPSPSTWSPCCSAQASRSSPAYRPRRSSSTRRLWSKVTASPTCATAYAES